MNQAKFQEISQLLGNFNYNDLALGAYSFNRISEQDQKTSKEDLINQCKLIQEECQELQEAFDANDTTEILDACVDILYVTYGLMQKLNIKGCNVSGAMQQVHEENMLKFPTEESVAVKTLEQYEAQGTKVSVSFDPYYKCYVIKDENNKVRKPSGFVSTDLSKHVPDNIKEL